MAESINQVDVVNMALVQLGASPITAFGQNAGGAVIIQKTYEQQLRMMLRRVPWNFARVWKNLNLLTTSPLALTIIPDEVGPGSINFTAAYQLPSDYMRLLRTSPYDAHWRVVGQTLYTDSVPAATQGMLLGTQAPNANGADNFPPTPTSAPNDSVGIEYVRYVDDPGTWDSLFMDAFVMRLAYLWSFGIQGIAGELRAQLKDDYNKAIADASFVNAAEQYPDVWNNSKIQDVRFGYSGISIDGM